MCRSMVDIPFATAEIRRGKKKIEITGQKHNVRTKILDRLSNIFGPHLLRMNGHKELSTW